MVEESEKSRYSKSNVRVRETSITNNDVAA